MTRSEIGWLLSLKGVQAWFPDPVNMLPYTVKMDCEHLIMLTVCVCVSVGCVFHVPINLIRVTHRTMDNLPVAAPLKEMFPYLPEATKCFL